MDTYEAVKFHIRNKGREVDEMILLGDCRTVMQGLEPESFHCCVTSPPYLWVRDYGVPPSDWPEVTYTPMTGCQPITVLAWTGCLGLEPTVEMFVAHIVLTMREVWRVLRKDGTLWLNFGDTYYGSMKGRNVDGQGNPGGMHKQHHGQYSGNIKYSEFKSRGLKPKDLIMVPARVALALQADGWYLRMDNIWSKPNPMPESAADRPTKAHEYMYLFSKSRHYYYDNEAIKEVCAQDELANGFRGGAYIHDNTFDNTEGGKRTNVGNIKYSSGVGFGHGTDAEKRKRGRINSPVNGWANGPEKHNAIAHNQVKANSFARAVRESPPPGQPSQHREDREDIEYSGMRNKRSVWTVATNACPEAHFATFPPKLIEPCILAGSSPQACPHCAAPWKKILKKTRTFHSGSGKSGIMPMGKNGAAMQGGGETLDIRRGPVVSTETTGWWPTCKCENNDGSAKCHILDTFGGIGTVYKVSLENNRECTSIDINPEYIQMQERRTAVIQPNLF